MILIVVKHQIRPEFADEFPSLVAEFTSATRSEPGNLFFDWYRSTEDANVYMLVEAFRDGGAGQAHVSSEHFKRAMSKLPEWVSDVPEIINVEAPGDGWSRLAEMQPR